MAVIHKYELTIEDFAQVRMPNHTRIFLIALVVSLMLGGIPHV